MALSCPAYLSRGAVCMCSCCAAYTRTFSLWHVMAAVFIGTLFCFLPAVALSLTGSPHYVFCGPEQGLVHTVQQTVRRAYAHSWRTSGANIYHITRHASIGINPRPELLTSTPPPPLPPVLYIYECMIGQTIVAARATAGGGCETIDRLKSA